MISYSDHLGLASINTWISAVLRRENINQPDFARQLYVFGVADQRVAPIYLSPSLPNVERLAEFISDNAEMNVLIELVGNPQQEQWIALRRDLRRNIRTSARAIILTWLNLNNFIRW